jgi:hypothetical protein
MLGELKPKGPKGNRAPERTQGFAADPVYVKGEVFAYVGLPQNLKDLKDREKATVAFRLG